MSARQPSPLIALASFLAISIVQSGMSLLLLPLYVTTLTPADYGFLTLVNVVAAIFGAASNLKLDAAMRTLYFDHNHDSAALAEYLRQAFTGGVVISALLCAGMLALGEPLFELVFAHAELRFFPAGALAVATAAINGCLAIYFAYLRNRLALREVAAWQLALMIGTVACQIAFVVGLGLGLHGVLWGSLLPAALALLALCAVRPRIIGVRSDWRRLLPSLEYSLPLVALTVCFVLATRLDRLVLERYVDLTALGTYSLLVSVLGLQAVVLNALDGAIRPYLFEALKEREQSGARGVESYQELYCLAGLLALSLAVFIGANLHWFVAEPAYLAIRDWLPYGTTACLPVILGRYYSLLHEFHKRSIELTASVVLRLVVLFVLLETLVPPFGVGGALTAVLVAEALTALWLRGVAARRLAVRPTLRAVGIQIAVFLVGVWGSTYLLGERSPALAGTLQLVVVGGLLLASNRGALRTLTNRAAMEGAVLASR